MSSLIPAAALSAAINPAPVGKPGDFDFLTGEWRIHNKFREGEKWIEFPGEATVVAILGGIVSIEELRIPARGFSGMGLRLLDVEKKIWSDHFVNAKSGVVGVPGQLGVFENGVGTFLSEGEGGADGNGGRSFIAVYGTGSPRTAAAGSRARRATAARHGTTAGSWTGRGFLKLPCPCEGRGPSPAAADSTRRSRSVDSAGDGPLPSQGHSLCQAIHMHCAIMAGLLAAPASFPRQRCHHVRVLQARRSRLFWRSRYQRHREVAAGHLWLRGRDFHRRSGARRRDRARARQGRVDGREARAYFYRRCARRIRSRFRVPDDARQCAL